MDTKKRKKKRNRGSRMRILLAGGGTAGHINPAISIASYAKTIDNDTQILFIGKRLNMEQTLVPKAGFDIEFIDIEGFRRSLTLHNIKVVLKTIRAISESKKIIKRFKPDVVICTGGYVSGPVMTAAGQLGVPSIIHEQNVFPGVTVKLSQKYASYIATSFEKTKDYLKAKDKCVFTGNPVREQILCADREKARTKLGLDERPFVLAFGGSLGAAKINEAVIGYIKELVKTDSIQLMFGTGKRNYQEVIDELKKQDIDMDKHQNIRVCDYIYDMDMALAAANVVIGRAGAISISEITALGKASILIPSPNVAHNHQYTNAKALEENGAAVVLCEDKLSPSALKGKIDNLLSDKQRLREIEQNAKKIGVCDASQKIYDLACKLTGK